MRAAPGTPDRSEQGFVFVGVVMFMLTLTILGLSLFALSSYEAQFFYASVAREQSLLDSESGVELVGTILSSTGRLEDAHRAEGQFGVVAAIAWQERSATPGDTLSNGAVDWSKDVYVSVTGRAGSVQRSVEVGYRGAPRQNPYRSLISCGLGLGVDSPRRRIELQGPVWQFVQSSGDTLWTRSVNWSSGRPMNVSQPPQIEANAYVNARLNTSVNRAQVLPGSLVDLDHGSYYIHFQSSGSTTSYWQSPPSPNDGHHDSEFNQYDFYADRSSKLDLRVTGQNVWVVDNGACFQREVNVVGVDKAGTPGPHTLIIVARANGRDPGYENRALWFKGGLRADASNVRVFLVSEGDVAITFENDGNANRDVRALTIAAGGDVWLEEMPSGSQYRLLHPVGTTSVPSEMDVLADQLLGSGVLPAITGGTGVQLTPVSWRETTPR